MATNKTVEPNWQVTETEFRPEFSRKFESILCQGNGYMGVRAATEEDYEKTVRYTLVAGTFDKMERKNTTELPNGADTTAVELTVDGIPLKLKEGNYTDYCRSLNLRDGILRRSFVWMPKEGVRLQFTSERFVSLANKHLLGQKVTVKLLEGEAEVILESGIRGGERYGDPHFLDMESRQEGDILQYAETTHESGITFVTGAWVTVQCLDAEGRSISRKTEARLLPDRILSGCREKLRAGESLVMEKLCRIATTRDKDFVCGDDWDREALLRIEKENMQALKRTCYAAQRDASGKCWEALWQEKDIAICGDADADQLSFRFAVYHLTIMAPIHDNRMNIGAKGLSGKGYFGHTLPCPRRYGRNTPYRTDPLRRCSYGCRGWVP